jgi:hypothetical protein
MRWRESHYRRNDQHEDYNAHDNDSDPNPVQMIMLHRLHGARLRLQPPEHIEPNQLRPRDYVTRCMSRSK